jgi:hypothetical protein
MAPEMSCFLICCGVCIGLTEGLGLALCYIGCDAACDPAVLQARGGMPGFRLRPSQEPA